MDNKIVDYLTRYRIFILSQNLDNTHLEIFINKIDELIEEAKNIENDNQTNPLFSTISVSYQS